MWNSVVGWFISSATSNTGFHETEVKRVGNCRKLTHFSPNEFGLDGKIDFHNFCKKKPNQTQNIRKFGSHQLRSSISCQSVKLRDSI